jgi:hypothetical protein
MQVRASARAIRDSLLRLSRRIQFQAGAILLVVVLLFLYSALFHRGDSDRQIVVAVSMGASKIPLSEIKCLSLNDNRIHIFGADYSRDNHIEGLIKKHVGVTDIFSPGAPEGAGKCEYFIDVNIIHTTIYSVRYLGDPAVGLAAVQICETGSNLNCTYRNIYFFKRFSDKYFVFSVAVMAFSRPYSSKWNIVQIIESDL